jgi:tyrosine-specific transport protein
MAFLRALSVYLGTVIGVGIFSLPFISWQAGFFIVLFYLLIMTGVIIWSHLTYADVVLGTEEISRLPGYVGKYLGEGCKKITFFIMAAGFIGALLAYLIVGGEFLKLSFQPYFGGSSIFYTFLFFALGAYLVFRDIKSVSVIELLLVLTLLAIVLVFLIKAIPFVNFGYFKGYNIKFLTFPYGPVLFSLWGSSIIPEIEEMFMARTKDEEKIRRGVKNVILWGTIFSVLIYFLFIFTVLGVSGPATSKEAISGLYNSLGSNIIKLGFIFGVISCFTSFITIALTLKKIFWFDFRISENLSWALSCFLPLALFIFGAREFIKVISLTGALALGLEGIIIVLLYKSFLRKKLLKKMNPIFYVLIFIFTVGIFSEIYYFFKI